MLDFASILTTPEIVRSRKALIVFEVGEFKEAQAMSFQNGIDDHE
jgi:hypothetical protein